MYDHEYWLNRMKKAENEYEHLTTKESGIDENDAFSLGFLDHELEEIAKNMKICPGCKLEIDESIDPLTVYNGKIMCEGCAENSDMFDNTNDPHGRDWRND